MTEQPIVRVFPMGFREEVPDGPSTVEISDRGCRFVLRFEPGDIWGDGPVQKLEVLPLEGESLEPRALRQFAPRAELYVALARAGMRTMKANEGTPQTRRQQFARAVEALRQIGGPGRGLSDQFYQAIGEHHNALVGEGEPHPIKTLGEAHHVSISAASRWVKEARRRGYLPRVDSERINT